VARPGALVDRGDAGAWAERVLLRDDLAAPPLMPVEVANILRRAVRAGDISPDAAALAHADLQQLLVTLVPYGPVAFRAWALREKPTMYDAWYVALAELLAGDVATLDARLARAPGPTCGFVVPEEGPARPRTPVDLR
jgi:predicted nucleic acid-binding protein